MSVKKRLLIAVTLGLSLSVTGCGLTSLLAFLAGGGDLPLQNSSFPDLPGRQIDTAANVVVRVINESSRSADVSVEFLLERRKVHEAFLRTRSRVPNADIGPELTDTINITGQFPDGTPTVPANLLFARDFEEDFVFDYIIRDPDVPTPDGDADSVDDDNDNCPNISNADQQDRDDDGIGDACDNCPNDTNPEQENNDGDTFGDACDNCIELTNADQEDIDNDGIGDGCDDDDDGDGVADEVDNCPDVANPDQIDIDADGAGDACDDLFDPAVIPIPTPGGGGGSVDPPITDCNGNGIDDAVDQVNCDSPLCEDCNGNGILDGCENLADCNKNMVPDECDIADEDSPDQDGNGVPDECQQPGIWFVDDDAQFDPAPGDPRVSDPNENGTAEHPFDAIQEAIDASDDDDLISVAPGTYTDIGNRDLNTHGKKIRIIANGNSPQLGFEQAIIDCQAYSGDAHRAFTFEGDETPDTVVSGFTIRECHELNGGAILVQNHSRPTLRNLVIRNNGADDSGGGIYITGTASPTLENVSFISNIAENGTGSGAACLGNSEPLFFNCVFSFNGGDDHGGRGEQIRGCPIAYGTAFAACDDAKPKIRNSLFENNFGNEAGAISLGCNAYGEFSRCKIIGNQGTVGGLSVSDSTTATFHNCEFRDNFGEHGAMYVNGLANVEFANTLFTRNTATTGGSLMGMGTGKYSDPQVQFFNCTVARNNAKDGFLIDQSSSGSSEFFSSILYFNQPPTFGSYSSFSFCDIEGSIIENRLNAGDRSGDGNIDRDPVFVNPDGGDFRLDRGSPCIDVGSNILTTTDVLDLDGNGTLKELLPVDLDDLPRFVDDPWVPDNSPLPIIDMGAYERPVIECQDSAECNDDNPCTNDICDPGENGADARGCFNVDNDKNPCPD